MKTSSKLTHGASNSALLAFSLITATSAYAVDSAWLGLNAFQNPDSASTDISDPANWSNGIPGVNDTAIFNYVGGTDTSLKGDLFITSANTLFNPSGLVFNGNVSPDNYRQSSDLYIDKSLNLTNGLTLSGLGATGGSGQQSARFRLGTAASDVVINASTLTFTNSSLGWSFITMGNNTKLNLTGPVIDFPTPANLSQSINGGVSTENSTLTSNPELNFTGVGADITLNAAGISNTTGSIGLGLVHLNVRSDQTWTADPLAFVSMAGSAGATGFSGKYIVGSLDGGRLDNLGELNLRVTGTASTTSLTTAMQLVGGTYGSFWLQGDSNTVSRTQAVKMIGDVNLVGNGVAFNSSTEAYVSDYGLVIRQIGSGTNQTDAQQFYTQGFDLNVTNGVQFDDASSSTNVGRNLKLFAENSTVSIGGDVVMTGDASKLPGGANVNTSIGIEGGANGANITLGGNWNVQTVAAKGTGVNNLSTSTLTMTGDGATFEVGDASNITGVQAQTWSIATFNVGVDAGNTANIQLVNNYLNDNPFNGDANVDKEGERLIVGAMNIRENSTLDANLGATVVEVASLLMETGSVLDLNTNIALFDGATVDNFLGLGDQTVVWTGFASQVIDSSNPNYAFNPLYLTEPNLTVWQATLVPEPGTWALMAGIAGLGLCIWRRRR